MARFYGKESKYLIYRWWLAWATSFGFSLVLIYIWYAVFVKNFNDLQTISGAVAIFIIFGPFAWYAYRQYKAFEKESEQFERGRRAEGVIFYELLKLPDDYCVFQDFEISSLGNTDFAVVGPTGIFTIEVKSHSGRIDFNGQELTLNGHIFEEKDILKQAMGQALDLHNYLKEGTGKEFFVEPVIVFSSFRARVHFLFKKQNNVFVVQKRYLRKLIHSRSQVLSEAAISEIEGGLKSLVATK